MATFDHKGETITFDERAGEFRSDFRGKRLRASSLPAMKKKIEAELEIAFEPFIALREKNYRDKTDAPDLIEVKIIRKQKAGRGRLDRGGYVDEAGTLHGNRSLLPNTAAARKQYETMKAAAKAAREAGSVAQEARAAVEWLEVDF